MSIAPPKARPPAPAAKGPVAPPPLPPLPFAEAKSRAAPPDATRGKKRKRPTGVTMIFAFPPRPTPPASPGAPMLSLLVPPEPSALTAKPCAMIEPALTMISAVPPVPLPLFPPVAVAETEALFVTLTSVLAPATVKRAVPAVAAPPRPETEPMPSALPPKPPTLSAPTVTSTKVPVPDRKERRAPAFGLVAKAEPPAPPISPLPPAPPVELADTLIAPENAAEPGTRFSATSTDPFVLLPPRPPRPNGSALEKPLPPLPPAPPVLPALKSPTKAPKVVAVVGNVRPLTLIEPPAAVPPEPPADLPGSIVGRPLSPVPPVASALTATREVTRAVAPPLAIKLTEPAVALPPFTPSMISPLMLDEAPTPVPPIAAADSKATPVSNVDPAPETRMSMLPAVPLPPSLPLPPSFATEADPTAAVATIRFAEDKLLAPETAILALPAAAELPLVPTTEVVRTKFCPTLKLLPLPMVRSILFATPAFVALKVTMPLTSSAAFCNDAETPLSPCNRRETASMLPSLVRV